jgi:hypothetical protein
MAAGFTMTSSYADNVAKSFDQLNPQMQRGLLRYEIDAVKWDKIRQAKLHSRSFGDQSVQFLRASDIAKIQGLAPGEARDLADTYRNSNPFSVNSRKSITSWANKSWIYPR